MAAKKEVKGIVKLVVPAKQANPAPPIGPALGAAGVNIAEFCKQFNDKTFHVLSQFIQTAVSNLS